MWSILFCVLANIQQLLYVGLIVGILALILVLWFAGKRSKRRDVT